ncbi:hypothetical protein C8J57DRAFT_1384663, partial [Mycena rebaudengoi]
ITSYFLHSSVLSVYVFICGPVSSVPTLLPSPPYSSIYLLIRLFVPFFSSSLCFVALCSLL